MPRPRLTDLHGAPRAVALLAVALLGLACRATSTPSVSAKGDDANPGWETDNPVRPLPVPPLGSQADFAAVPWVTPEKVRLGRWLFHDVRLSADGTDRKSVV